MALLEPLWRTAFEFGGTPVSWAEVIAFGLSLWMVERNMRVSPWGWPLAIVASLLYGLLFAQSGLYGEAALQALFIAVSVWGWRQWLRRDTAAALLAQGDPSTTGLNVVHYLKPQQRLGALLAAALAWPLLGLWLARWTDSTVPYADAAATSLSVVAQWLLGRKAIENWWLWVVGNAGSVALFWHKGLLLTALLYALFALLSLAGAWAWHQQHKRLQAAQQLEPRAS